MLVDDTIATLMRERHRLERLGGADHSTPVLI